MNLSIASHKQPLVTAFTLDIGELYSYRLSHLQADASKGTGLLGVEVAALALGLLASLVLFVGTTVSRCPGKVRCLLTLEVKAAGLAVQEQHDLQWEST